MKKIIISVVLVLSIGFNIYFLVERQDIKRKINFVNGEVNALIGRGDIKGSYELARTITNTFGIPREGMCKALENAAQKFHEQGNKDGCDEALRKVKEQRMLSGG